MKGKTLLICTGMMLVALWGVPVSACDVSSGPLYNQSHAESTCPGVCAPWGGWSGNWTSYVCGCFGSYVDINAGPIWNTSHAQTVCPQVASGVNGTWTGQWHTTVPGSMSVCGILVCS